MMIDEVLQANLPQKVVVSVVSEGSQGTDPRILVGLIIEYCLSRHFRFRKLAQTDSPYLYHGCGKTKSATRPGNLRVVGSCWKLNCEDFMRKKKGEKNFHMSTGPILTSTFCKAMRKGKAKSIMARTREKKK